MGNTEIQRLIDNKSVAALRKFARAEAEFKKIEKQRDEVLNRIKEAMIAAGKDKIDGDWGYITLGERVNYKAEDIDEVDEKYTKRALDTAKVKAEAVLTGKLPAGITESRTQFITKKIKEIE